MTTTNTNSSARTLTIPNLVNGQIYRARVSAINNYGQGPFANWIQVTPSEFSTDEYYYDNTLLMHFDSVQTGTYDIYGDQVSLLMHMDGLNNSTSFIDSSIYNRTINRYGDSKISSNQSIFGGTSAYFDGSGDYLAIPNANDMSFGTGDFTVELWVNVPDLNRDNFIFGPTNSGDFMIQLNAGGQLYIGRHNVNWDGNITHNIQPNTWTHIAITRNQGTMRFFINGSIIGSPFTNNNSYVINTLYIGTHPNGSSFYGYMDEIRITKGTARYISNFSVPAEAFPAILPLSIDSSAYQRRITPYGNAALSNAQSKFGNSSVYFDGSGDYLSVTNSSELNFESEDFTIEFWIYLNSIPNNIGVIGKRASEANYAPYIVEIQSGILKLYMSTTGSSWTVNGLSTTELSTNTWYHIAFIRSGSTIKLFLNGISIGSTTSLSGSLLSNSDPLYIGANSGNPSGASSVDGYLDDLRITKGVARYSSNFSVPVAPAPDLGPASTIPSTPSNLAVSEDQGVVSLSWTRPSSPKLIDSRSPITYYGVEYSSDGGSSWTEHSVVSGGSLLTRSISGLPANTPYLFRVRAQNSVGFGNYSSTANISTLTNVPSSVSAIGDDNQAYVSWTAPTPNNSSIRDYGIQYSPDSGGSWYTYSHSPSIDTLINVTGLNNTSNYSFKVAAVNLAGTGIYSSDSSPITVAPRSDNLYNKTRILLHLDSN